MTSPIKAGLVTAIALFGICLVFALWNPAAALPPAIVFLLAAFGIRRGRRWSAYGAALFLLALVAAGLVASTRAHQGVWWGAAAVGAGIMASAAFPLYRAGRRMLGGPSAGSRWSWLVLAAVVFLFPQIMRPYVISAGSMETTLLTGDQFLSRPLVSPPARGELVMLRYPVDPTQIFVKRLVAVAGDRLRLENKRLILNGSPVSEPYAIHTDRYFEPFRDNFPAQPNTPLPMNGWAETLVKNTFHGELVIPAGKFFVMGDNRDNSLDSRYWGFLEAKDFVGKPVLIYFSAERTPSQMVSFPLAAPPVLLHPSSIRWGRLIRML